MRKPNISVFISIFILGGIFLSTGCETEQTSKKNDGMVGYAQDHAKAQAELINQEQLKKSSLTEAKVVADGTARSLNSPK
ncbi:hypothetical protein [Acinetobacter sp. WCHA39]|uniref:hypothetical protein n=1 Tax=Acinetobacter sp. WCHA39 TaxID=2004648 RepID=UPI000B3BEC2A|nr:hypothetical protein [Acinetobacter sp. WCHA39]